MHKGKRFLVHIRTLKNFEAITFNIFPKIYILRQWKTSLSRLENTDRVGFEEVVGQEHITTTLKNAIDNNKLAQALLFCGPRGVGKTTCARIVARLINDQTIDNPLMGNDTFNIYELDAASNNSVDDIRNLIEQVRYPPQQGKFKVYIIDEVHMLSNQAFNAFFEDTGRAPLRMLSLFWPLRKSTK